MNIEMNEKTTGDELEQDHTRWHIVDPASTELLYKLPITIDPEKWRGFPAKEIPRSQRMEWGFDERFAAKFPSVCALSLQKTFRLVGRRVDLKLAAV